MTRLLHHAAFAAGLLALAWVGQGYLPQAPLALTLVLLIAVFYAMGAFELHRYRRDTAALARALDVVDAPPAALAAWLDGLPGRLRHAVRLRIEGERAALPGPALSPYLTGLLVLLGMLGTFLGMVATLKGTGLALENATDVAAIRASLAVPVQGLGLAFGCSVAGVAASAMLGLMSSLARRERQAASARLDACIATTLRGHSRVHQREEMLRLLQDQAGTLPALVQQLQALVTQVGRQGDSLQGRLVDGQERFHAETRRTYTELAASVDGSLKATFADSAHLIGQAIEPAVRATMASLGEQTASLQRTLDAAVRQHLEGVAERLDRSAAGWTQAWTAAVEEQRSDQAAHARAWQAIAAATVQGVERQAEALLDGMRQHTKAATEITGRQAEALLAGVEQETAALLQGVGQQSEALATSVEQRTDALLARVEQHANTLLGGVERQSLGLLGAAERQSTALLEGVERQTQALIERTGQQSEHLLAGVAQQSDTLLAHVERHSSQLLVGLDRQAGTLERAATEQAGALLSELQRHSAALLAEVAAAHARLDASADAREQQRRGGWQQDLGTLAAAVREEGRQAAAEAAARQDRICGTLEQAAQSIAAEASAQARATIAEIGRLLDAAAEAPRAAADAMAELRRALSDSLARDNAALDERNRLLGTLQTLLEAVEQTGRRQQGAIEALIASSTEVLDRAGRSFSAAMDAETSALRAAADQVSGGAAELGSLSEGFGVAVEQFGQASAELAGQLQRIEAALGQSMARSDEQLAYYVAQARELVELTVGSQKQIVDDLQRVARVTQEGATA